MLFEGRSRWVLSSSRRHPEMGRAFSCSLPMRRIQSAESRAAEERMAALTSAYRTLPIVSSKGRMWGSLLVPVVDTVDCRRPEAAFKTSAHQSHRLFSISGAWSTFNAMPSSIDATGLAALRRDAEAGPILSTSVEKK